MSTEEMVGQNVPDYFDYAETVGQFELRSMKNVIAANPRWILAYKGRFMWGAAGPHVHEDLKKYAEYLNSELIMDETTFQLLCLKFKGKLPAIK